MKIILIGVGLLGLTVIGGAEALADPAPDTVQASGCKPETFEGDGYVVCTADPKAGGLRLFWQDGGGQPYRTFDRLAAAVTAIDKTKGQTLLFATNAGMYSDAFAPVGLYVEEGRELRPLNTGAAERRNGPPPNFYRKPNGVFLIDATGAKILPTDAFLQRRAAGAPADLRFATQSGPMLVIDGKLHPDFIPGSSDRTRRSGVGVCEGGVVRVAVSEDAVNFDGFARFFRDRLGCPNALFLDGGRGTGLYDPALGRDDTSGHGGYGPILALVGPAPQP